MKGFFKFLIGLIIVVALVIGGLYSAISIPKKVNVSWTEKDMKSYMSKAKAQIFDPSGKDPTIKPASMEDLLFNNFKATGSIPVEGVITSSEVTAMVNTVTRGTGLFKDLRLGFREDGTMEASAYIGPEIDKIVNLFPEVKPYENLIRMAEGKPIYMRYTLTRVGNKKFDAHTQELQVGQVPIPLAQAGDGLTKAGTTLNNMMAKIDGFSCEQLKIDKEGFHFKGSIPDKLEYVNPNNLLNK
jgi:hypothetical protein